MMAIGVLSSGFGYLDGVVSQFSRYPFTSLTVFQGLDEEIDLLLSGLQKAFALPQVFYG